LDDTPCVLVCKGKIILSILMANVTCLTFSMQEEDIHENTNGKCHLCILWSTCIPLCDICMHLITLLNTHANILVSALEHKCHKLTLMVKLVIINVT
jgi:hypothetical protein